MTEFVMELLRLRGEERWGDLGDGLVGSRREARRASGRGTGRMASDRSLPKRGCARYSTRLGRAAIPVTKEQSITLYPETSELRAPRRTPDVPRIWMVELPEDNQFGLVVVDCAWPDLHPRHLAWYRFGTAVVSVSRILLGGGAGGAQGRKDRRYVPEARAVVGSCQAVG